MIRISVIVPTFERGEIFTECLDSILVSIGPHDEIIIVNDSKRENIQLAVLDHRIRVLNNPNSGVASARNLGAQHAKGTFLLFIDDDMIINAEAIESCYELIQKSPNSTINSDWIYNPQDLKEIKKTSFGRYLENIQFTSLKGWCPDLSWKEKDVVRSNCPTSQFMLIEKTLFHTIHGYNEDFPFAGFEDYDLGKRLEKKNVAFFINTACCVYHNEKDRIALKPFLERKKRGGFTRKIGENMGYPELRISFSGIKKIYFWFAPITKNIFFLLINITPNSKLSDGIFRFFANRLIGIYIYEGYSRKS